MEHTIKMLRLRSNTTIAISDSFFAELTAKPFIEANFWYAGADSEGNTHRILGHAIQEVFEIPAEVKTRKKA